MIPLISIFDVHGLPYTIGMTACAASHAAVNGGAASASWANGNTPVSPSAYKSADREQASSPVCLPSSPSVPFGKPYLLYPFYIPLCTHCFRSVYLSFSIGFIGIDAFHQSMPSRVILLQNKCGVACRCKPALAEIFLGASLQAYFCRPVCRKAIPPHYGGRKITCKGHRNMVESRGKNKICQI